MKFKERLARIHSQAMRFVGELRGKAWGDFEWRTGIAYGRAVTRDEEQYNVRDSRLRAALLRADNTALNPFGYTFKIDATNLIVVDQPYANPASVVDPLYDTFIREGKTELTLADAKIDGTLFRLKSIPFNTAFGAEFRFENYKDWRPAYAGLNPANDPDPLVAKGDNDYIGLSPNVNIYSERTVISGFAELFVPIVNSHNRMELLHSLELSAAVRTERFSQTGTATKPKFGLGYRPTKWFLLRTSYNESFRAPNLVQTNTTPLQRAVTGISDPYRSEVTNLLIDGSSSRTVFRLGNDKLKPEVSRTWTLGAAIEVPRVKGLSVTFDYFHLHQSQVIDNLAAADALLRDEELLDLETQRQLAAGKAIGQVDLGSGSASYAGNPSIKRAPVTQPDIDFYNAFNATHPAAQQRAPVGRVATINEDYLNLAGRDVAGWEAAVQYRLPKTFLGQFTLRSEATYSLRYEQKATEISPVESLREENGRPRWRANGSLSWRRGGWNASWFTNYWGEFVDTSAATTQAVFQALGEPRYIRHYNNDGLDRYYYRVKQSITHTVNVGYAFGRRDRPWVRDLTLRAGVSNLLNTKPPLSDETRGGFTGTVSARGRVYTLQITKRI